MTANVLDTIKKEKFIAIARGIPPEDMPEVARAVYDGGVKLLEITFSQHLPDAIERTKKALSMVCDVMEGRMFIGAGTVLNTCQVRTAFEAGAKYIISPNTNPDVIQETKKLGMVSIPGAMTPTEIVFAWDNGADLVKLFPADDLGYHYIRNILSPLSHIPIIATGGVNPETIPEYLSLGVTGVAAGITIIKPELVKERNFSEITRLARLHVEAVKHD